jgi:hypothetical protein
LPAKVTKKTKKGNKTLLYCFMVYSSFQLSSTFEAEGARVSMGATLAMKGVLP